MATLIDNPSGPWVSNETYELAATDPLQGAASGAAFGGLGQLNQPHQQLANRTAFLKGRQDTNIANIAALQSQQVIDIANIATKLPTADITNNTLTPVFAGLTTDSQLAGGKGEQLVVQGSGNGVDAQIRMTCSAYAHMYQRVGTDGTWNLVNSGYTAQIFTVDQSGNVTTPANVTASGTVTGGTVNSNGTMYAAGQVQFNGRVYGNTTVNFCYNTLTSFSALINQFGQPAISFYTDYYVLAQAGLGLFLNGGNGVSQVKLDTGNNVTIPASCTATQYNTSSDARLKQGIRDIEADAGVRFVLSLAPRRYSRDGRDETGFIAQEAASAGFGHLVGECDSERPEVGGSGKNDRVTGKALTLNYNQIIAYQQAALRAALLRIEALERGRGTDPVNAA